jgi:hypothetical protein
MKSVLVFSPLWNLQTKDLLFRCHLLLERPVFSHCQHVISNTRLTMCNSIPRKNIPKIAAAASKEERCNNNGAGPIFVASLSNKAAQEIIAGNYSAASDLLSSALVAARARVREMRLVEETPSTTSPCMSSLDINDYCSFYSVAEEKRIIKKNKSLYPNTNATQQQNTEEESTHPSMARTTVSAARLHQDQEDEDDSGLFLFRTPLKVNLRAVEQTDSFPTTMEVLSFVAVLNLALCRHLMALASSSNHPKELGQVIALYSQATRMLPSFLLSTEEIGQEGSTSTTMFEMVISNNLGHAYCLLQYPDRARRSFQRLAEAIAIYCNDSSTNASRKSEELDKGFVSNIMWLLLASNAAAAA